MKKLLISSFAAALFSGAAIAQDSAFGGLAATAKQLGSQAVAVSTAATAKAKQLGTQAVAVSSAAATKAVEVIKTNFGAEVTVKDKQLLVVSVTPGSRAEKAGLVKDDVITAVNGVPLTGKDIKAQFAKLTAITTKEFSLQINRKLTVPLK